MRGSAPREAVAEGGSRIGVLLGSGAAGISAGEGVVARDRHGDPYRLPHQIDHEANLRALLEAGCDRVLGISSVGGLRPEVRPGTYLVPDDYIALDLPALTTFEGVEAHRVAAFDPGWRRKVIDALRSATEVVEAGVYWQVKGPRFETAAEVRLIAQHAHVVGMTVASECIVACELGVRYAALCVVDNLANGLAGSELTRQEVERGQLEHRPELATVLAAALAHL